MYWLDYWI